jgi:catechol 2,3-dioxygenase-like lactoylglutathione lyase family enzyme
MTRIHLSLNVTDLARAVAFYEAFLGVAPHKTRPGYVNFEVDEPPLKLALNEHPEPQGRGALNHLGFQVGTPEAVLAVKERLQARGLATFDEMDTTCCYARQDKIWVHDPDGNPWEVYALTDDLLDDYEHDHAGRPLSQDGAASSPALFIPLPLQPAEAVPGQPLCCREEEA